jgi:carbamate kinase
MAFPAGSAMPAPRQHWLDRMTIEEANRWHADDEYEWGSMGPKIKALSDF